jgi:hypothetical protein
MASSLPCWRRRNNAADLSVSCDHPLFAEASARLNS